MADETSTVQRVKHGKRETATVILTANNLSVREDMETGEAVLELFRYSAKGEPVESYQFRLCAEDRERVRALI